MNVLYASNEHKVILIICPHCKFGSRYDGSYIEDAIKIRHDIVCVACGEVFNLVVSVPSSEAVEQTLAPDAPPESCEHGNLRGKCPVEICSYSKHGGRR